MLLDPLFNSLSHKHTLYCYRPIISTTLSPTSLNTTPTSSPSAAIISGFATVFFPLEQLLIFRGVDAEQLRRREASLSQILREIATRKKQILVISLTKLSSSSIHSPSPMMSSGGGGGSSSGGIGGIGGTAVGGSSSGGQLSATGRSRSRDNYDNNSNNNSNSNNNNNNNNNSNSSHVPRQYSTPSSRTLQTLLGMITVQWPTYPYDTHLLFFLLFLLLFFLLLLLFFFLLWIDLSVV